jgi:hypothetical protein
MHTTPPFWKVQAVVNLCFNSFSFNHRILKKKNCNEKAEIPEKMLSVYKNAAQT